MEETSESIRQQIDETKLQLAEKLESLEQQVSDTVQNTGTAMTATAESVQDTVQTLSNAIRHTVDSVTNGMDLSRQIERHPWLVIGGCVALGYVASGLLMRKPKTNQAQTIWIPPSALPPDAMTFNSSHQEKPSALMPSEVAVASKSVQDSSIWHQLGEIGIGVLIGIVQDVANRAAPQIVDYLTNVPGTDTATSSAGTSEHKAAQRKKWPSEVNGDFQVASSRTSPMNASAARHL